MRMRKIISVFLTAVLVLSLASCGSGLSKKEQEEIDRTVAEYTEKLVGPTWWNDQWGYAIKFYEDGTVEDEGYISEPGNWYISYGEQYNRNADVSKMSRKYIDEFCGYYLRYDSPAYSDGKKMDCRISFTDDGNLVLFDDVYYPGPDYIHEVPEDTYLDPYFYGTYKANNWGVWAFVADDGSEGKLWVFQDDGLGAETIGAYGGELIYPDTFTWSFKDGMLYIEWPRSDEYIAEYGKDIDAYNVERGDGEFWITSYLDRDGSSRQHLVQTDNLDIAS